MAVVALILRAEGAVKQEPEKPGSEERRKLCRRELDRNIDELDSAVAALHTAQHHTGKQLAELGLMYSELHAQLDKRIAGAVEQAMRNVLADEEVRKAFWKGGYDELSKHTRETTTQWVGRRMVSAFSAALLAAAL